jgi:hypothetical protein
MPGPASTRRIGTPATADNRHPPCRKGCSVRAGTQITVLVTAAAITLGVGFPVLALTLTPSTERLEGTVVSVVPADHTVLVHDVAGAGQLRGHDVLIHVPAGQQVTIEHHSEDLDQLRCGQEITARVRVGSHRSQWITASGPAAPVRSGRCG